MSYSGGALNQAREADPFVERGKEEILSYLRGLMTLYGIEVARLHFMWRLNGSKKMWCLFVHGKRICMPIRFHDQDLEDWPFTLMTRKYQVDMRGLVDRFAGRVIRWPAEKAGAGPRSDRPA